MFKPLNDEYWLFLLKRNRNLAFGVMVSKKIATTIKGVTDQFTDDEWLEAMRIHSEIINETFYHPAIEQIKNKPENHSTIKQPEL